MLRKKKDPIKIFGVILVIVGMFSIVLISGCNNKNSFFPLVDFKLNEDNINVNDNTIYSKFIEAKVTRLDNKNIPADFIIKFNQPANAYAVDVDGNRIDNLSTPRPLEGKGDYYPFMFKVFGKKGLAKEVTYNIQIELWWNGTKLENKDNVLEVTIK